MPTCAAISTSRATNTNMWRQTVDTSGATGASISPTLLKNCSGNDRRDGKRKCISKAVMTDNGYMTKHRYKRRDDMRRDCFTTIPPLFSQKLFFFE